MLSNISASKTLISNDQNSMGKCILCYNQGKTSLNSKHKAIRYRNKCNDCNNYCCNEHMEKITKVICDGCKN